MLLRFPRDSRRIVTSVIEQIVKTATKGRREEILWTILRPWRSHVAGQPFQSRIVRCFTYFSSDETSKTPTDRSKSHVHSMFAPRRWFSQKPEGHSRRWATLAFLSTVNETRPLLALVFAPLFTPPDAPPCFSQTLPDTCTSRSFCPRKTWFTAQELLTFPSYNTRSEYSSVCTYTYTALFCDIYYTIPPFSTSGSFGRKKPLKISLLFTPLSRNLKWRATSDKFIEQGWNEIKSSRFESSSLFKGGGSRSSALIIFN